MLEELKKYHLNGFTRDCYDIADKLMELTTIGDDTEARDALVEGLYYLNAVAQNPYNADHFRVLYNVLLMITETE